MPKSSIETIIYELSAQPSLSEKQISKVFMANPSDSGKIYSKSEILKEFHNIKTQINEPAYSNFLKNITMKKVRTLSGVTTVTVLTKPFACPGKCIFCPNDVRMPKSYISSEPGAQRAKANEFDPYLQTYNRLLALSKIGHATDKVELIVLGGTWTAYPEKYQIWFIKRCFDAMNEFQLRSSDSSAEKIKSASEYDFTEITDTTGKINYNLSVSQPPDHNQESIWDDLEMAHKINISAKTRCVGLSIETRPDEITQEEVIKIRRLGATKVQIGVQSLDDNVLNMNKRGHDSAQTALAFKLLRQAGFKIHCHYMPNLYGATPQSDIEDFSKLFSDPKYCPDEIKIYPCSLIDGTELMDYFKANKWKPYTHDELVNVVTQCLLKVPAYCRVTRVIRDIPGQEIVVGNKETNLRQTVEQQIESKHLKLAEIRSREIRGMKVKFENLDLNILEHPTTSSDELFFQYITTENQIAGFLRLSLPKEQSYLEELKDSAIIREVHVYGVSIELGQEKLGSPQHIGLGTKLIDQACKIAKSKNWQKIAVISSIGTQEYYKKFGFEMHGLYQTKSLD